jgi:hypothetical protein
MRHRQGVLVPPPIRTSPTESYHHHHNSSKLLYPFGAVHVQELRTAAFVTSRIHGCSSNPKSCLSAVPMAVVLGCINWHRRICPFLARNGRDCANLVGNPVG